MRKTTLLSFGYNSSLKLKIHWPFWNECCTIKYLNMHWAFETYSKKITPCSLKQFYLGFYILEIRTKFVFGYTQNIYLSKNNHIILFIWFLCLPRTLIVFGKKYYMWVGWQNLSFCNMIFNTFYWHFPVPSSFGVFWYKPFFLKKIYIQIKLLHPKN